MLQPKKMKYRKRHRGRLTGEAQAGNYLAFGDFGLMAMERFLITSRQIEAARIAMTRHMKRGGKVWIRIFPHVPYTKKPAETRMGKGKGNVEHYVAPVKPGTIMFEIAGVPPDLAREAIHLAGSKLPIPIRYVSRIDFEG